MVLSFWERTKMKVRIWVAGLATCSVLAVSAPLSAQFGGLGALKKKLESAAKELEKPKSQPQPQPTPAASPTPASEVSAATPPSKMATVTKTIRYPDQNWECSSGFPDGELSKLRISELTMNGDSQSGVYEIQGFHISEPNKSTFVETGSVIYSNGIYNFSVSSTTLQCAECEKSFLLSPTFSKSLDEDGKPLLTEQLTPERKSAFENDEFDGTEQSCGAPGTWSAR